mgnify:CR=1 FL=1
MNARPLNVAVIGAGPAGIYASDILSKSGMEVCIDLFERLPAPYGLVRYGVAPDHPRIKQIIVALYKILQRGDIRLIGNVEVGRDISVAELHEHYDAIVFSTGADTDAPLDIPGVDAPECHGGADFVSWYDGHPDHPRTWDLSAKEVAVIGVGNVALDIARVLAKHADDLMTTEIPANVAATLRESPVTEVHVFGRRGPAQVKFTPLELRELGKQPDVDVIVDEEDFEYDEGSQAALASSNQQRQVVKALEGYAMQEPEDLTASHRIHIHLFSAPHEVLTDDDGHVVGLRTERTRLTGDGNVTGTGEYRDWPVQAVYRAVGYASSAIEGLPFDAERHVVPNEGGRVLGEDPRDADWRSETLVMHIRECSETEIRIPIHVGENRSRTWVATRQGEGLRLKHDHRHEDGSEDVLTQYGGDTDGAVTGLMIAAACAASRSARG